MKPDALPPNRPWNESAGYLGYYCNRWLPEVFDLIDCDGGDPAVWLYYQCNGRTFRIIEEKPSSDHQHLRKSEIRAFAALGASIANLMDSGAYGPRSGVFVIYGADRLATPEFPIEVEKRQPTRDKRSLSRKQFDNWLLLAERDR